MATLREIGKSLGLSPATVSRALNGFPEVGERTRARVVEAARMMDYRPNQVARKLVTGRSGIIGLVVARPRTLATDTTFFNVVSELSASLAERDVDLVLHVASDADEVEPYRRLIAKGTLDGFVVNGPRPNDPRISFLTDEGVAFVVHGRDVADAPYPYFDIDNRAVSASAVELLCDLGHQRIALLNGPGDRSFAHDRRGGFFDALALRGRVTPSRFAIDGAMSEDQGYIATLRLLSGSQGPVPTALVCGSTLLAAGAMKAALELGLVVPRDLSILAHDDHVPQLPAAGFAVPLTTTSSPLTDASAPLAELLLARLDGETDPAKLQRIATAALVVRRSTGPVPPAGRTPWTADLG